LNGKNLFAEIQKVSLQLDKPQTVRLFLYSSIQTDPIATFDLSISSDFDKIMTDLSDFLIKYQNENGENIKYLWAIMNIRQATHRLGNWTATVRHII